MKIILCFIILSCLVTITTNKWSLIWHVSGNHQSNWTNLLSFHLLRHWTSISSPVTMWQFILSSVSDAAVALVPGGHLSCVSLDLFTFGRQFNYEANPNSFSNTILTAVTKDSNNDSTPLHPKQDDCGQIIERSTT